MRTTADIKNELDITEAEIKRISDCIIKGSEDDPYRLSNGEIPCKWTFNQALVSFISKRSTLKWVLKKH